MEKLITRPMSAIVNTVRKLKLKDINEHKLFLSNWVFI